MTSRRIHYGRCSFVPPHGFVLQKGASLEHPPSSNHIQCFGKEQASVCITLTSSAVHHDVPDFSESPEDMNPDAYPATLILTTLLAQQSVSPLDHLRHTAEVLKGHFEGFRMDFCEKDIVGEFPAARSQGSFVTNFRIFRLNYAWAVNGMLFTSEMTLTESGVEKGWTDLRKFVESVSL
jgi:hypothetical protein